MNVNIVSLTLALDAIGQQAALGQEQYDWLQLQKGYNHFLQMNEGQLQELLQEVLRGSRVGRYSPLLVMVFEATIEARISFLRNRNQAPAS
jgi:hypothetical protein